MVEVIGRNENLALLTTVAEAAISDTNISSVVSLGKADEPEKRDLGKVN